MRSGSELPLLELPVDHATQLVLLRRDLVVRERLERGDEHGAQPVGELALDRGERRLDDLVEELVADRIELDPHVGEAGTDRREVDLLDHGVGDRRDGGHVAVGALAGDPEAGEADGARLGGAAAHRGADAQPRREDRADAPCGGSPSGRARRRTSWRSCRMPWNPPYTARIGTTNRMISQPTASMIVACCRPSAMRPL